MKNTPTYCKSVVPWSMYEPETDILTCPVIDSLSPAYIFDLCWRVCVMLEEEADNQRRSGQRSNDSSILHSLDLALRKRTATLIKKYQSATGPEKSALGQRCSRERKQCLVECRDGLAVFRTHALDKAEVNSLLEKHIALFELLVEKPLWSPCIDSAWWLFEALSSCVASQIMINVNSLRTAASVDPECWIDFNGAGAVMVAPFYSGCTRPERGWPPAYLDSITNSTAVQYLSSFTLNAFFASELAQTLQYIWKRYCHVALLKYEFKASLGKTDFVSNSASATRCQNETNSSQI